MRPLPATSPDGGTSGSNEPSVATIPAAEVLASSGRICTRCVIDESVPNVTFDEQGICNHCRIHDDLNRRFPVGEAGEQILQKFAARIKQVGRGRDYDCIVGFSGGRDTSYCLYQTKRLGLRPLALHFDNGWDSDIAKSNIRQVCTKLDVDLETVIADWEESRELTNCTIRAQLPYIDLTDDIGIVSALYRTAAKHGIRYIIHSHSFRSEGINPLLWNYVDARFVRGLIRRFCRINLKQFKNTDLHHLFYWAAIKRIRVLTITNYYQDSGPEIDEVLKRELGWKDTGGWHYDNEIFGLQCYYSRRKFGFDWRIIELAALVREGAITREGALADLATVPPIESPRTVEYALKKQGLSIEEFEEIMKGPNKYYTDYPTYYPLIRAMRLPVWLLCKLQVLPPHTYEKYFVV